MGVLYLALDPAIDRLVALKVLRVYNEDMHGRFIREAKSAGRLQHPNIVTIYDVGEHEGQPFIAMEYIAGETLTEIIRRRAPLAVRRRVELIEELCAGLHYAHRAGIVHRDVKPANLIVNREGLLKILDFGIARLTDSSHTQAGMMIGTPNYMAPEQVQGLRVDHRADIFAVGLVLYELLSYQQGFPGEHHLSVLQRVLSTEPEPLPTIVPGIDPDLVRIVVKALQKSPDDRYQDLAAMASELSRVRLRLDEGNYDATIVVETPRPAAASTSFRARPERQDYVRRRALQIENHLRAAEEALRSGDLDHAMASVEEAALLDPSHGPTLDLLTRVRLAIDERSADQLLQKAAGHLNDGALTVVDELVDEALPLDRSGAADRLKREVREARQERERRAEQKRDIDAHLDRARKSLERGSLESVIGAADEVLAQDSASEAAQALKQQAIEAISDRERRAAHTRAALELVQSAREQFARGERAEALARLQAFTPSHAEVANALETLGAEHDRLEAERREEEEARRRRDAWLTERVASATGAMGAGRLDEARQLLVEIERSGPLESEWRARVSSARVALATAEADARRAQAVARHREDAEARLKEGDLPRAFASVDAALALEPDNATLVQLRASIDAEARAAEERRKQAELDRLAAEAIASAKRELDAARPDQALRVLERFPSPHPLVQQAIDELHVELARRQRQREEEAARRADAVRRLCEEANARRQDGDFARAFESVDQALRTDPNNAAAIELRATIEREARAADDKRRRAELDRLAAEVVAAARADFAAERHDQALRRLERFPSAHPLITQAVDELRRDIAVWQQRRAEEAARRETERLAAEAQREVDDARAAFAAGRHREALDRLARYAPPHALVAAAQAELSEQYAQVENERRAKAARQQAQRVEDALSEAGTLLARRDFDAALEQVSNAQAVTPGATLPPELRERITAVRRSIQEEQDRARVETAARDAIAAARALVATGDHRAALRALERFVPTHPAVQQALADIRAELARFEEAKRAEEAARRALDERADAAIKEARRLFAAGEHEAAFDVLEQVDVPHERVSAAITDLRATKARLDRQRREEEARRQAEVQRALAQATAAIERRDFTAARKHVDAALAREPSHHVAAALGEEIDRAIEEERKRAEQERRVRERDAQVRSLVERARRTDRHPDAIALLEQALALDPSHTAAQALLQERRDAIEEARRAEADRAALAAAAGDIRRALDRGDLDAAAALLADADARFGSVPLLDELERRVAEARDAAQRQERAPFEDTATDLLRSEAEALAATIPPPLAEPTRPRGLQRRTVAALAAAAAIVVAGTWYAASRFWTATPATAIRTEQPPPQPAPSPGPTDEDRARQVIDMARKQWGAGDRAGAIARLESFAPKHPLVTQATEDLKRAAAPPDTSGSDSAAERQASTLVANANTLLRRGQLESALSQALLARALPVDDAPADRVIGQVLDAAAARAASAREDVGRVDGVKADAPLRTTAFATGFAAESEARQSRATSPETALARYRSAETAFRNAAELTRWVNARVAAGRERIAQQRWPEAVQAFRDIRSRVPQSPWVDDLVRSAEQAQTAWVATSLATARERVNQQRWADALQIYREIKAKAPQTTGLEGLIADVERNQTASQANAQLQQWTTTQLAGARTAIAARRWEEADRILREVRARAPATPGLSTLADEVKRGLDEAARPTPTPPPTPTPTPATPNPAALKRDEALIQRALHAYEQAFERRDVDDLKAVWPTIDQGTEAKLRKAFEGYDRQSIEMNCRESIDWDPTYTRAKRLCAVTLDIKPKAGSRTTLTRPPVEFVLEKRGDLWVIVSAGS